MFGINAFNVYSAACQQGGVMYTLKALIPNMPTPTSAARGGARASRRRDEGRTNEKPSQARPNDAIARERRDAAD